MQWKYVKKLKDKESISSVEKTTDYTFPILFKEVVERYNGSRPSTSQIKTSSGRIISIKSLLSFNPEDKETVYDVLVWNKEELGDKFVPFMIDNFGNLICFDKRNNHIVFVNHETESVDLVSLDFESFIRDLF